MSDFREAGMKGWIENMGFPFLVCRPVSEHIPAHVCVSTSGQECHCAKELELLRMSTKTNLKPSEVGTEVSEEAFALSSVGVTASNCNGANPSPKCNLKNSN